MKTADPELMRAINRFNVLDTIRRHGPISRVEISERTELSTTTVSAITASLLDDGLILPRHEGDLRNEASRGRPRVMLEINPDAARVVGAKIAANRMVFAVTNFRGEVLSNLTLAIRVDRQPIGVIADLIEDGVRRCVVDAGLALEDVDSVCLGLPGVIEHRTGRVRSSPIFREANVDFVREMSERLVTPTIVESDAHAITLAHHWFGEGQPDDNIGRFPFPTVSDGPGLVTDNLGRLNGWVITVNAPPETEEFLKFLSDTDNQRLLAEKTSMLPIAKGANDGVKNPLLKDSADALDKETWHQNFLDQDLGPNVGAVVNDMTMEIVAGQISPADAAQQIQDAYSLEAK